MKFTERYGTLLAIAGILIFLCSPLLLFPLPVFEAMHYSEYRNVIASKITINLFLVGMFFLNLKVLTPWLLEKKNIGRFITLLAVLLILFLVFDAALYHITHSKQPPFLHHQRVNARFLPVRPFTGYPSLPSFIGSTIWFLLIIVTSSMVVLVSDRAREKNLRQQIMYEKIQAELAVLKLQISPHFLFNTLNNIRFLARKKSDETEEAVVELAQILRYMIYQVNDDKVDLLKEIQYLERYINLQKMRLQPNATVTFDHSGNDGEYRIEPLLFIPFVENAFKYGVHSHKPSAVRVQLDVEGSQLSFYCENNLFDELPRQPAKESGLGIANVKRRLELYYPNSHQLKISKENGVFSVYLNLTLTHG